VNNNYKVNWAVTIAALVLGVAGFAVSLSVDTSNDGQGHTTKKYEFKVNEAKGDGAATKQLTVPAPVVQKVVTQVADKGLRDETPPLAQQVAPGELTAAQQEVARIKATQPPLPTAGASEGFIGCRTQFVRNQSSRNGTRPQLQVLHYTVSRNILGWADVNAIVALFDRTSAQASSNFVIDAEGNCAYIVPIEVKAWTQAAANPYSVSYEVVDYGNESVYMQPAGYAKLRSVMLQVATRTGIPMRAGIVNGCVPARTGIVQHKDFGYCGGGHFDITPFSKGNVIRKVTVSQPVPRKVKWIRHLALVHDEYQKKCKHFYQRQRRPVTCANLRKDGKTLRQLVARK
jgi:hypothetical protein